MVMTKEAGGGTYHTVFTPGQLTLDNVKLAFGNIWQRPSQTEVVPQDSGPTAGMWIYIRDKPEQNRHQRVRVNEVVQIENYRIQITEIDPAGVVTIQTSEV